LRQNSSQPLPDEFAEPLARGADRIGAFVSRVLWYPEVTSTNDVAAALAESGGEEGLVVAADAQSTGRGRHGRVWASPPGVGIYATILLRPSREIASLVTIAAGVAIADGIESATGLPVRVKWPNDVFVEGPDGPRTDKKLAGILAEGSTVAEGDAWLVLGFGINVLPGAYPADIAARATSLEAELGRPVDRGLVLAECLAALSDRYRELRGGRVSAVIGAWRSRAASTFGRRVEWNREGQVEHGVAQDIDPAGALLVRTDAGVRRVISGEVRWI
jgi:BirA family transcriptional regulator, biotin operon repressor / biotin---[acetyl-CoA-carboxylase] ligase